MIYWYNIYTGHQKFWVLVNNFFGNLKTIFNSIHIGGDQSKSATRKLHRLYENLLNAEIIGPKGGLEFIGFKRLHMVSEMIKAVDVFNS